MTRTTRAALLVLAALAATHAGCRASAPRGGPPPVEMRNSQWLLVSLYGEPPVDEARVAMQLDAAGTASGHAGINRFSGPFQMQPLSESTGRIAFGELTSTRMGGPPELMEQETRFLEALQAADSYRAEGGLMELLAGRQPLMRFRQTSAGPDTGA